MKHKINDMVSDQNVHRRLNINPSMINDIILVRLAAVHSKSHI